MLAVNAQAFPGVRSNSGWGGCHANGGVAAIGNVNSGWNSGSEIMIGHTWGEVDVFGGRGANSTAITHRVDGGLGLCGAGGGWWGW